MPHRFVRWKTPISHAQSVQEVHDLMQDYLATLSPELLSLLPATMKAALTVDDIAGSAVILIREEINYAGNNAISELLHEIAHTYVAASTRIAAIQARGQPITSV